MATLYIRDEHGNLQNVEGKKVALTEPQLLMLQVVASGHFEKGDTRVVNQLIKKGMLAETQGDEVGQTKVVITAAGKKTLAGELKPTHTRTKATVEYDALRDKGPSFTPLGQVESPAQGFTAGALKTVKKAESTGTCLCGCGGVTKSSFMPGHDARYKSFLKKIGITFDRAQGSVADFAKKHGPIR